MKLENTLTQKMLQTQKLSLKQQYSLKVLEMNNADLIDAIVEELEINPVLEACEEIYSMQTRHHDDGFDLMMNYIVEEETLSDVLLRQLHTYHKPVNEELGTFLIQSLSDDGYLRISNKEIEEVTGFGEEEIEELINIIQTFEPYGVGARTLEECLVIQLSYTNNIHARLAIDITAEYLDLVGENKIPLIAEKMKESVDDVKEAIALIKKMDPRPGSQFMPMSASIEPDVRVSVNNGEIQITLLSDRYDLRINEQYQNTKDDAIRKYLSKHMKQAELLIDSLEKRNRTLLSIVDCIVNAQREYFISQSQLQPLTMRDIAETIGIHESTISRSIANKYMDYNQKLIPLKFFFVSKLESGESSNEVQLRIKEMIDQEDKKKPLSDAKIADLLGEQDIQISRRTVAKYRDQLNIPSTSKRKEF